MIGISTLVIFLILGLMSFRALEQNLFEKIERAIDVNSPILSEQFWHMETADIDNDLRRCGSAWTRATRTDTDMTDNVLRAMVQDMDIVSVAARDADGTEFCRRGLEAGQLAGFGVISQRLYYAHNGTQHDVGELDVHVTKASLHKWVKERTYLNMVSLVLLLVATSVSIIIATQRSIKVPLGRLLHSIRMNKHGCERKPVEWKSQDELGQLISEYNEMLELQAIFQNVHRGICMFNKDLELVVWNEKCVKLFNIPADLMRVGTPLNDLLYFNVERGEEEESKSEDAIIDWGVVIQDRKPYTTERTCPNGQVILIELTPMPRRGICCHLYRHYRTQSNWNCVCVTWWCMMS